MKKGGDFVDFIRQLVAFDKKSSGNLTPVAIAIYLKLFMINNERGREEWFEETDYWLGRAVGIKRRETIVSALNMLKQKGFIDFERGGAHKSTRYHIVELSTGLSTNNPQPLNNSAINSAKDSAINSAKDSAFNSAKDSAKNVFLQSNKKKKIKGKIEGDARAREFTPPTLEDVNNYVIEKNLHVSAKKFWEYYDAGSWKDAKGNPVRNWKQKLLTWESHEPRQEERKKSRLQENMEAAEQAIAMLNDGRF